MRHQTVSYRMKKRNRRIGCLRGPRLSGGALEACFAMPMMPSRLPISREQLAAPVLPMHSYSLAESLVFGFSPALRQVENLVRKHDRRGLGNTLKIAVHDPQANKAGKVQLSFGTEQAPDLRRLATDSRLK